MQGLRQIGVTEHRGDGGEHRGKRCTQLVRERGKEAVLGDIGGLGFGAGGLFAEHADPLESGAFLRRHIA